MMPLTTKAVHNIVGLVAEEKASDKNTIAEAFSAYQITTKPKLAEYHHYSLFTPPTSTILKAIKNNQLTSFPGLDETLLKQLPPSTATYKGHMQLNKKTSDQRDKMKRTRKILDWMQTI